MSENAEYSPSFEPNPEKIISSLVETFKNEIIDNVIHEVSVQDTEAVLKLKYFDNLLRTRLSDQALLPYIIHAKSSKSEQSELFKIIKNGVLHELKNYFAFLLKNEDDDFRNRFLAECDHILSEFQNI
jgi:hypothetical protein